MDATPLAAAEAAGERARQLAARREQLSSGASSTEADVLEAGRSATVSAWRAKAAHTRAGLAHDRAALAHDRAASALEHRALTAAEPKGRLLLHEAEAHRRAARADREAAEEDRRRAEAELTPDPD
jgi:hypothetical protein